MDIGNFFATHPFLIPGLLGLVGLFLFYAIVRSAVSHGMRDYQRWMDNRARVARLPVPPQISPAPPQAAREPDRY